jgi:hypothetical protein
LFLLFVTSRPTLGPTQLPLHWIPEVDSLEVKWQGREADYSPQSSVEVKKVGAVTLLPRQSPWGSALVIKPRHIFMLCVKYNAFLYEAQMEVCWVYKMKEVLILKFFYIHREIYYLIKIETYICMYFNALESVSDCM